MDKEAVGMERGAFVSEEMLVAGARSLIDGQEKRPGSSWAEEALRCYEAMHALAQQPSAQMFGATSEHNGGTSEHKASAQQAAPDEQTATIRELLQCFLAWEKDVRVLGNVRAEDAADAMRAALAASRKGEV